MATLSSWRMIATSIWQIYSTTSHLLSQVCRLPRQLARFHYPPNQDLKKKNLCLDLLSKMELTCDTLGSGENASSFHFMGTHLHLAQFASGVCIAFIDRVHYPQSSILLWSCIVIAMISTTITTIAHVPSSLFVRCLRRNASQLPLNINSKVLEYCLAH